MSKRNCKIEEKITIQDRQDFLLESETLIVNIKDHTMFTIAKVIVDHGTPTISFDTLPCNILEAITEHIKFNLPRWQEQRKEIISKIKEAKGKLKEIDYAVELVIEDGRRRKHGGKEG